MLLFYINSAETRGREVVRPSAIRKRVRKGILEDEQDYDQ